MAVFGLGNSDYDDNYCKAARTLLTNLEALGAKTILDLGLASDNEDMMVPFNEWIDELLTVLKPGSKGTGEGGMKRKGQVPLKEFRKMKKNAEKKAEEDKVKAAADAQTPSMSSVRIGL